MLNRLPLQPVNALALPYCNTEQNHKHRVDFGEQFVIDATMSTGLLQMNASKRARGGLTR